MLLKQLGKTKTKISAIGQGTGFDLDEGFSQKELTEILRKGVDLGMTLIDTGENYRNGESEIIVGKAIKGIRNKVIVATKFLPQHSSYKKLIKAAKGSLRRLGTDYIDLYQLHWLNPKVPFDKTASALISLKKRGLILHIGVSNLSKKELIEFKKALGNEEVVSLQSEFNLFERTIEQNSLLSYCRKNKITVIAYSPLDQGRIDLMDNTQKALLLKLAEKYKKTITQIILRWVISKPQVVAIPKTTNKKHLRENATSCDFNLSDEDKKVIDRAFSLRLRFIKSFNIRVSEQGERNYKAYQTLEEAIENKLGLTPSPVELAESIKSGGFLKPVRLIRTKNKFRSFEYDLIGGRLRYWAWVIAFGGKKRIPAYIRKDI